MLFTNGTSLCCLFFFDVVARLVRVREEGDCSTDDGVTWQ